MTASCEITERSARGYCPEETEGHVEEVCAFGAEFEDAPFCKGPSDQAPADAEQGDDSFTDVCVEQGLSFDYETGECFSEVASTSTAEPSPPPVDQPAVLPEAGLDVTGLLLIALGLAHVGWVLRRWV